MARSLWLKIIKMLLICILPPKAQPNIMLVLSYVINCIWYYSVFSPTHVQPSNQVIELSTLFKAILLSFPSNKPTSWQLLELIPTNYEDCMSGGKWYERKNAQKKMILKKGMMKKNDRSYKAATILQSCIPRTEACRNKILHK